MAQGGALADLKVVDLSRVLGGPFCTHWLGDHGAEVVKVEPPQGDETRLWGPPFDAQGTASYFLGVNRSKRGVALDLRREAAREALLRLLEDADVLVENFRIGTMEKWGLGYEERLAARFPRLVYCRISGFGADGPLGGLPGYDAVVQAQAGLMSVNGAPGTGPMRLGVPVVDIATGMAAAFGILAALHERDRSGRGQFVEASLYDVALSLLFPHSANWLLGGGRPKLAGSAHPNITPYDKFATATCEIFIGCGNDGQFRALCVALGIPELAEDERFRSNAERTANRAALRGLLEARLSGRDGEALAADLMRAGVPAGPVLGTSEVLTHPHTTHRGMVVEIEGQRSVGNPVRLSRTLAAPSAPAPAFGGATRAVLAEAGYGEEEIEALIASGAAIAAPR